ncbi:MAG: acyl-CoA thioesterase [Planctomycetota bacterium]
MPQDPPPNLDGASPAHSRPSPAPDEGGLTEPMLALRVVPMPRDTNAYGTIFGGVIMSYIDQAGLVEAIRHAPCAWVTASIERIDFDAPVQLGDVVSLYTKTVRTGRSSIRINVEVEAMRRQTKHIDRVTTATLTMVAVDSQGKPTPFRDASDPACPPPSA